MENPRNRPLGDGVSLVREAIFRPDGNWSIRHGEMVWSKVEGWKRYYEIVSADSRFHTAEDALNAWECLGSAPPLGTPPRGNPPT